MDFLIDKVNGHLNKAICKHAKEKNLNPSDVQILFYLKGEGFAAVKMCEHYQPIEEITFKKAMGVKFDLLNMAGATEYFVQQSLFDFCSSDDIKQDDVSVMIIRKDDENMLMHLYNKGQHVRKINPSEIFDQTKIKTA